MSLPDPTLANLPLALFALFALVDWIAVARDRQALEWLAKPAALAALLLWAGTGAAGSPWLLAALLFSLLGDVYLMMPANLFVPGLASFLIGHLAYVMDLDASPGARAAWMLAVLVATGPLAVRLFRGIPSLALRGAVGSYMLVISVMIASAIASGNRVAAAGAVLFGLSDSLIGWTRFVRSFPGGRLAIIVTYHVGQLLLVAALR